MLLKITIVLFISILTVGCTSAVTLSTHYPHKNEYDLSFGWKLVNEAQEKSLTQREREAKYEDILNKALKSDPNTKGCSIIKNSFHYFEPGCCAAARVFCQEPIHFEVSGIHNSEGLPLYFYRLNNE